MILHLSPARQHHERRILVIRWRVERRLGDLVERRLGELVERRLGELVERRWWEYQYQVVRPLVATAL